jgi:hypothetical protein
MYDDDCCSSPQLEFTVRNGTGTLANDTRATVTLPEGVISDAGINAIRTYLRHAGGASAIPAVYNGLHSLSYDVGETVTAEWQSRGGNFTKRLSARAFKVHALKIDPEILAKVGNIARDHSKAVSVTIDVTRQLNQPSGYFYHDDSCWWGSYGSSRCALKTNGGFGLRALPHNNDYGVTGRAWVLPLLRTGGPVVPPVHFPPRDARGRFAERPEVPGKLVPTFNTLNADAMVVFNGYGELGGYAPARIVADMTGWTYKRISFSADPMYINSGGFLIGPEEITQVTSELYLSIQRHSRLYHTEQLERNAEIAARNAEIMAARNTDNEIPEYENGDVNAA